MSNEFPLPAWMTDGKGLRGDAVPIRGGNIAFPPSVASVPENQTPIALAMLPIQGGGAISTAAQNPFQIIVQQKPGSTTQWQFGVVFNSTLYSNSNVTVPPTIPTQPIATGANGLLTSATPASNDAGWVTWNAANDYAWLEGTFGTWPAISTVQIQSLSNGGSYGGGDCENDGGSGSPTVYTQTKFRVLIGTLAVPTSPATSPIVKQICNRNLKLYPCWMDSFNSSGADENIIAAIYPFVCQA
jgi:hypothetical protein